MCLTYCSFEVKNDVEQGSVGSTLIYSHLSSAKLSKIVVIPKNMVKIIRDKPFFKQLFICDLKIILNKF